MEITAGKPHITAIDLRGNGQRALQKIWTN